MVIRLHPHLNIKHAEDLQKWLKIDYPDNATLLLPDDPTDSYTLMEQSSAVVTFSSTTGVEAVFWGTPSICLGPNIQSVLDAVYTPKTKEDLRALLTHADLQANPKSVYPFGYFMSTFGEEFRYYKPETLFRGKFLGVNIQGEHTVKWIKTFFQPVIDALRKVKRRLHKTPDG